jgi:hypothetical protein
LSSFGSSSSGNEVFVPAVAKVVVSVKKHNKLTRRFIFVIILIGLILSTIINNKKETEETSGMKKDLGN